MTFIALPPRLVKLIALAAPGVKLIALAPVRDINRTVSHGTAVPFLVRAKVLVQCGQLARSTVGNEIVGDAIIDIVGQARGS